MSSDVPLLARSRNKKIQSQQGERGCGFAILFAHIPEKGIWTSYHTVQLLKDLGLLGEVGFKCKWRLGWYLSIFVHFPLIFTLFVISLFLFLPPIFRVLFGWKSEQVRYY